MIAVIFEVQPKAGRADDYLAIAADLKSLVASADGFISVERFKSVTDPDKYLSLSFWRDEAAVKAWREQTLHRSAQRRGREDVFADYRLRVCKVVRDYGMDDREQVPNS